MTGIRLLGVGVAVVLAAGGCARAATGNEPVPAASLTRPTAAPRPSGPPLGTAATANNGQVEATVFGFRTVAGTGWAAADVQVCVVKDAIFDVTVSQGPWLLLLADRPGTPASPAPDGTLPQPAYPSDHRRVPPGGCVRGWLGFAVPAGTTPIAVQYTPTGADPITWSVD